jgi:hypothetical protein
MKQLLHNLWCNLDIYMEGMRKIMHLLGRDTPYHQRVAGTVTSLKKFITLNSECTMRAKITVQDISLKTNEFSSVNLRI